MWFLVGQRVHWVCVEGEMSLKGLRVGAVTGAPAAGRDLAVSVGRGLIGLDCSVNFETLLLLETGASTVEAILDGLRLSRWCLRRVLTSSGAVFLEGSRKGSRCLKTWELERGSLDAAIEHLLEPRHDESLLVDPFAMDLRSLRGAERAGLHSVSFASSAGISRHVAEASGFSLKVEIPSWSWVPPFLLNLSQHGKLRVAARNSHVSPARIYQAMKWNKNFRLAVNAVRTGGPMV